jgi:hypothetical protein
VPHVGYSGALQNLNQNFRNSVGFDSGSIWTSIKRSKVDGHFEFNCTWQRCLELDSRSMPTFPNIAPQEPTLRLLNSRLGTTPASL